MRGGSRPGAGRKPGTPNKASDERQAEIAASGLTPLQFMMSVLRNEAASFEDRKWAAKEGAPYVHPRLSSVDMKADVSLTHEQWLDNLPEPGGETPSTEG
jgi:hypothetical protein